MLTVPIASRLGNTLSPKNITDPAELAMAMLFNPFHKTPVLLPISPTRSAVPRPPMTDLASDAGLEGRSPNLSPNLSLNLDK